MTAKPYAFSCKAVIRDPEGRCLVLRRSAASKNNAGKWEFPGGKMDIGEDPGQALMREIREETGLEVELVRVAGSAESELPKRKIAYLILEAQSASSAIEVDPETYTVKADGQVLTCEPASELPMARRYFLF